MPILKHPQLLPKIFGSFHNILKKINNNCRYFRVSIEYFTILSNFPGIGRSSKCAKYPRMFKKSVEFHKSIPGPFPQHRPIQISSSK